MVRVDLANCLLNTSIECGEPNMLRIARFVEGVVSSNPRIASVPGGDLLPEPNSPVLVVLVIPESSIAGRIVGVPVWILTTRDGMHV
jgi:hypothetical protein